VTLGARHDNRSALALRKLREKFPEVLERYQPVYGGAARDDYLEYYWRTFLAYEDPPEEARPR
jgi:hypothetical protein